MKMSHLVDVKSAFELGRRYAVGGGLCCLCLVSQIIFVSRVNDANLPDNARLLRCFNEQLRRLTALDNTQFVNLLSTSSVVYSYSMSIVECSRQHCQLVQIKLSFTDKIEC